MGPFTINQVVGRRPDGTPIYVCRAKALQEEGILSMFEAYDGGAYLPADQCGEYHVLHGDGSVIAKEQFVSSPAAAELEAPAVAELGTVAAAVAELEAAGAELEAAGVDE